MVVITLPDPMGWFPTELDRRDRPRAWGRHPPRIARGADGVQMRDLLDRDNPIALHSQLKAAIDLRIESGEWHAGEPAASGARAVPAVPSEPHHGAAGDRGRRADHPRVPRVRPLDAVLGEVLTKSTRAGSPFALSLVCACLLVAVASAR